jgi:hypothetical protein
MHFCDLLGVMCETDRTHVVLFGLQNRTFVPYLAAINKILISLMNALGYALHARSISGEAL